MQVFQNYTSILTCVRQLSGICFMMFYATADLACSQSMNMCPPNMHCLKDFESIKKTQDRNQPQQHHQVVTPFFFFLFMGHDFPCHWNLPYSIIMIMYIYMSFVQKTSPFNSIFHIDPYRHNLLSVDFSKDSPPGEPRPDGAGRGRALGATSTLLCAQGGGHRWDQSPGGALKEVFSGEVDGGSWLILFVSCGFKRWFKKMEWEAERRGSKVQATSGGF